MFIYVFLAVFGAFFSFIEVSSKQDKKSIKLLFLIFYILFAGSLIVLTAFRENVGNDYLVYKDYYNGQYISDNFEIGFKYLIDFFKYFNFSYNVFQIMISLFTGCVMFLFFYKKSKFPIFILYLYFCLFFYVINFSQLRQYIAISILMLFSLFNKKNNKILFFLGVCISFFIHKSSILVLFIPIIEFIFRKKEKIVSNLIFIFSLCFIFLYKDILNFLSLYLFKFKKLPEIIAYYVYTASLPKIGIGVFASVLVTILVLYRSKNKNQKSRFHYIMYFFLEKAGCVINVFQRVGYYFELNYLGIDCNCYIIRKRTVFDYFVNFLFIMYFLSINIRYLLIDGEFIIPYSFL